MKASLRATVLAAVHRPSATAGGKDYLDVYLRQEDVQGVVEAYVDPADVEGLVPSTGDVIIADVTVYPGRYAGRMSVRVDAFRAA